MPCFLLLGLLFIPKYFIFLFSSEYSFLPVIQFSHELQFPFSRWESWQIDIFEDKKKGVKYY